MFTLTIYEKKVLSHSVKVNFHTSKMKGDKVPVLNCHQSPAIVHPLTFIFRAKPTHNSMCKGRGGGPNFCHLVVFANFAIT